MSVIFLVKLWRRVYWKRGSKLVDTQITQVHLNFVDFESKRQAHFFLSFLFNQGVDSCKAIALQEVFSRNYLFIFFFLSCIADGKHDVNDFGKNFVSGGDDRYERAG